VASEASPQEQASCTLHGKGGEGDRLLGGLLRGGDQRKAAGRRRLDALPLGGGAIPTTMTPIDGSFKSIRSSYSPNLVEVKFSELYIQDTAK
jgi:hypothetical protein